MNRLKHHLREHKTAYLLAGATVATAVVSCSLTYALVKSSSSSMAVAQTVGVFNWKPVTKATVKVIRRGHPGLVVRATGNGIEEVYSSVRRMCEVLDINRGDFWKYSNGLLDNVKGYTFEILGEAANGFAE